MTQAKRCKCGEVLLPGESHDCPAHGRRVGYSDNVAFVILDGITGIALLDDDGGIGDAVGDFIGDLFS